LGGFGWLGGLCGDAEARRGVGGVLFGFAWLARLAGRGGLVGEHREAEKDGGSAAGGFSRADADQRVGVERETVVFIHEAVEQRDQDAGGGGEEVRGDESSAPEDGGLDEVEALGDVWTGHPEGECFEGDAAGFGDFAQGACRICEFIQDLLDRVGMGVEVRHDGGIVAVGKDVSIAFCTVSKNGV
jgi:hypothetical protein